MKSEITGGQGRTQVSLQADSMGNDLVVRVFNSGAHVGAVAIGEYDFEHQRASVSVLTRLGHKDDAIARKAAYQISKSTKKPVCVVVGIHLDDIKKEEIDEIQGNALSALGEFIKSLS